MSDDHIFVKFNPLPGSRSLFCEQRGLEELRRHQSFHQLSLPKVESVDSTELRVEKIHTQAPTPIQWGELGRGLALLHQVHGDRFGFSEDNFIGRSPQLNTWRDNWGEFFLENRLNFQLSLIRKENLQKALRQELKKQSHKIVDLLNAHQPKASLLHGDLWSGNVLFDSSGPWLIDPAVYYGDRECDLAMTRLFGGFPEFFYQFYERENPLPEDWSTRLPIYNLYHELNHFQIFGDSYWPSVKKGFLNLSSL